MSTPNYPTRDQAEGGMGHPFHWLGMEPDSPTFHVEPRPLAEGEAIAGYLFPDDVNPALLAEYGALWVLGFHIWVVCADHGIEPHGHLETQGTTDRFTDQRLIRWALRP